MAKKITNANLEILGNLTLTDILNASGNFITVDGVNKISKRTPAEVLVDIGAAAANHGYVHDQGVAASVWNVNHALNRRPSTIVVDSAGGVVVGRIDYIDDNNITITFNAGFSGSAYFN